MRLSISVPDGIWILLKARFPTIGSSELVQKALFELLQSEPPTDQEMITLGKQMLKDIYEQRA